MPLIRIPRDRFQELHEIFLDYMLEESGGEVFVTFEHSFFLSDEVDYKRRILSRAADVLELRKWRRAEIGSGTLLERVRAACAPSVSNNLLEHKYGASKGSYRALHIVRGKEQCRTLEALLYDFFRDGDGAPTTFGPRFDALADFLREHSLGAGWDFLSYLAGLRAPTRYFAVRASRIQALFDHFDLKLPFTGHASWDRYENVLALAMQLKEWLALYGTADQVEIQSYIWVISGLIDDLPDWRRRRARRTVKPIDLDAELLRRQKISALREQRGLRGEIFVLHQERERLRKARCPHLADRVRLISAQAGEDRTYDIASFNVDGTERRIEVKTTSLDEANDQGFWLSSGERARAMSDPSWCLYRVWDIEGQPFHRNLGNVMKSIPSGWSVDPASWIVRITAEV